MADQVGRGTGVGGHSDAVQVGERKYAVLCIAWMVS
jgi:hypothetical protein